MRISSLPPFAAALLARPFFGFAAVGAASTAIDLVLFKLLLTAGANLYLATAAGFIAGLTNGYFLNSRHVFQKERSAAGYARYFIVSAGGLLWTELIVHLLAVEYGLGALAAKLAAVAIVFFWNYGLSKAWAFK